MYYIIMLTGMFFLAPARELSGMGLLRKWLNQPHTWLISHGFGDPGNKNKYRIHAAGKSPLEQLPRDIFTALVTPQHKQYKDLQTSLRMIQKLSCVSKTLQQMMTTQDIAAVKTNLLQSIDNLREELLYAIQKNDHNTVDRILAGGHSPSICNWGAETSLEWMNHYRNPKKLIATYSEDELMALYDDIDQADSQFFHGRREIALLLIERRMVELQSDKPIYKLVYEDLSTRIYNWY